MTASALLTQNAIQAIAKHPLKHVSPLALIPTPVEHLTRSIVFAQLMMNALLYFATQIYAHQHVLSHKPLASTPTTVTVLLIQSVNQDIVSLTLVNHNVLTPKHKAPMMINAFALMMMSVSLDIAKVINVNHHAFRQLVQAHLLILVFAPLLLNAPLSIAIQPLINANHHALQTKL